MLLIAMILLKRRPPPPPHQSRFSGSAFSLRPLALSSLLAILIGLLRRRGPMAEAHMALVVHQAYFDAIVAVVF